MVTWCSEDGYVGIYPREAVIPCLPIGVCWPLDLVSSEGKELDRVSIGLAQLLEELLAHSSFWILYIPHIDEAKAVL